MRDCPKLLKVLKCTKKYTYLNLTSEKFFLSYPIEQKLTNPHRVEHICVIL